MNIKSIKGGISTTSIMGIKTRGTRTSRGTFNLGFTLVEILVVILIFSIIGYLATQSIILSLRGSRKSEEATKVRENVEYAMNVMERTLRNANRLDCSTVPGGLLNFEDEYGNLASFACEGGVGNTYISSNSARLTSPEVRISNCNGIFVRCTGATGSIEITIAAESTEATGIERAQVTSSTRILLRSGY